MVTAISAMLIALITKTSDIPYLEADPLAILTLQENVWVPFSSNLSNFTFLTASLMLLALYEASYSSMKSLRSCSVVRYLKRKEHVPF